MAPPIAKLVEGIINATTSNEPTPIEDLKALTNHLPTLSSPFDAVLLKQLKVYLLSGQLQATNSNDASELHAAKWNFLTKLSLCESVETTFTWQDLQAILSLMLADRLETSAVLTVMAQWLIQMTSTNIKAIANLLDVKLAIGEGEASFLDVIQQIYVTVGSSCLRQELADVLEKMVTTKDQAKQIVKSRMLRSLLQVALEQPVDRALLHNFNLVGTRVASFVCVGLTSDMSTERVKSDMVLANEKQQYACKLVVTLMLSGVSLVIADAVHMLELLLTNAACRALLPAVPDLRGSLEKVCSFARLKTNIFYQDDCLRNLCEAQYALLSPEIDTYEREHGSVVGLPSHDEYGDPNKVGETALALALKYKTQGNAYFHRGNYPTARVFYRRAIAVLKSAQLQEDTLLRSLSGDELLKYFSVGASVQVCTRAGSTWQNAMISDVQEHGASSQVEVLYDAGDREDEWVPISRIRLRMNTKILTLFDDLMVNCSMNMGKAFSALSDHDQAIQCFTHALDLRGGKLIAALYCRGVANMARRELTDAKQDLWNANQQCRVQQRSKINAKDTEQLHTLHKQITAAYKKLQQMYANKKRLDKKVIKEMVKYVSTIPEFQDQ